jgi:hypothetical protein
MKAVSGILLFESGLVGVMWPFQQEAERSAKAIVGQMDPATLGPSLSAERMTLGILFVVSVANACSAYAAPASVGGLIEAI